MRHAEELYFVQAIESAQKEACEVGGRLRFMSVCWYWLEHDTCVLTFAYP